MYRECIQHECLHVLGVVSNKFFNVTTGVFSIEWPFKKETFSDLGHSVTSIMLLMTNVQLTKHVINMNLSTGVGDVFLCGMFAGLCYCITHPIETVKTRVQVTSGHSANTKGFFRAFAEIAKTEGTLL